MFVKCTHLLVCDCYSIVVVLLLLLLVVVILVKPFSFYKDLHYFQHLQFSFVSFIFIFNFLQVMYNHYEKGAIKKYTFVQQKTTAKSNNNDTTLYIIFFNVSSCILPLKKILSFCSIQVVSSFFFKFIMKGNAKICEKKINK